MHKGSLTQKVQFYTLLRMVSIGQLQMSQNRPVQVDFNTLNAFQRTQLNFPYFANETVNLNQQQQQQVRRTRRVMCSLLQPSLLLTAPHCSSLLLTATTNQPSQPHTQPHTQLSFSF